MLLKCTNPLFFAFLYQGDGENWKKIQNYLQKVDIWSDPTWNMMVPMTTSKIMETFSVQKFPQRMKEQLLKVSFPYSKSSFQTFERPLWGGGGGRNASNPRPPCTSVENIKGGKEAKQFQPALCIYISEQFTFFTIPRMCPFHVVVLYGVVKKCAKNLTHACSAIFRFRCCCRCIRSLLFWNKWTVEDWTVKRARRQTKEKR